MKSFSGRAFARLVEQHGWTLLRVNGSHHIYGKAGERARLSVPIHAKPLKSGLLRSLAAAASLLDEVAD